MPPYELAASNIWQHLLKVSLPMLMHILNFHLISCCRTLSIVVNVLCASGSGILAVIVFCDPNARFLTA